MAGYLAFVGYRGAAEQSLIAVEQYDFDAAISQRQRCRATLQSATQDRNSHFLMHCRPTDMPAPPSLNCLYDDRALSAAALIASMFLA